MTMDNQRAHGKSLISTDDETLNTIIQTLSDRDIPYDRNAIEAALADPVQQTAIREWVEEFLTPETLLTMNEANVYDFLMKTGEAEALSKHDLFLVAELHDHELVTAIEGLRRSTLAIKKQIDTLRLQQNTLSTLIRNEKRSKQARSQAEKGQVRKWDAEKSSVAAKISELTQALIYQTSDTDLQLKTSANNDNQIVDSILKADDKLLLSFQKLASDLETSKPENEETIASVKKLCARYIKFTVESVRTRLDRIYLEALVESSSDECLDATAEESKQLQEDLEYLYTEILPVAQMSAEQQYLDPVLRAVGNTNINGQHRTSKALEYISNCLAILIDRIKRILDRAQERQCYKMAVESVLKKTKEELSSGEVSCLPTAIPPSLAKACSSPRQDDQIGPQYQLGRSLGIKLPELGTSEEIYIAALEKHVSEKSARLESNARSLQSNTESCISSHLLDANITLSRLRDLLLSHSAYHNIKLVDPELVNGEELLEKEIYQAKSQLDSMNFKDFPESNSHRDKFVNRWSR